MFEAPVEGKQETECSYQGSEELELPHKLQVTWVHLLESIRHNSEFYPTNDWKGCSDSVEANLGMTAEQFSQSTNSGDLYEQQGLEEGFSGDLYVGYIFGRYDNLTSRRMYRESNDIISLGPNNERAMADEYVVLYNNMTVPQTYNGQDMSCAWFSKLPQGFSCGKGAPPDEGCKFFPPADIFTPVPCSEIVVKVLDSQAEHCPQREANARYDTIYRPSQPDCWATVGWL